MARLPVPGEDDGVWGVILNDYLSQTLKVDGTIKDGIISSAQLASNSVSDDSLAAGAGTDGQVLTYDTVAGSKLSWQDINSYTKAEVDTALDGKISISQKGVANGVATLDGSGKIPGTQVPAVDLSSTVQTTGDQTIGGVKTFSSSPIGPNPTSAQQLATKSYVDSQASASFAQNKPWFIVTEAPYNADRTGATDAAPAIQQAINDANTAGGGVVYIPDGDYLINYSSNVSGLGVTGGLQLYRNIWLKGEGNGTRLIPGGVWSTLAGVVGLGDATTSRGNAYNIRVSDLFIKSSVGALTSGAQKANTVAVLFNTSNGDSPVEPDAAHRIHDLLIWDMYAGIMILGDDDQAMMVQRIRGRRFTDVGMQIGRSDSSGGGPDNYFAFLDFSSANIGGGTAAVFEVYAANCHFVSCKAWYAKRSTAFVAGSTYKDGAGWYIRGTRNAFVACEAQDNGGHGFLISYGKNTLTGCIADSNSYYDNVSGSAAVNECSGFYITGSMVNVDSFISFSRSASHFDQKYGVYIDSSVRNISVTGQAFDNRATTASTDPADGVAWSAAKSDTHIVHVGSYYTGGSYISIVNPSSGATAGNYEISKVATAKENVVTGTTLTDDAGLSITGIVGGAVRYRVEGYIQYYADATTHGKIAVAMAVTGGSGTFEVILGWNYISTAGASVRSNTYSSAPSTVGVINVVGAGASGAANIRSVHFAGSIYAGTSVTAATFKVQLAESTGTGVGMKISTGSWIRLSKM